MKFTVVDSSIHLQVWSSPRV